MSKVWKDDKNSTEKFVIVASIAFLLIALMTYGNLFNTYLFDYFKAGLARETNWFMKLTHYFGAFSFAGSIYWMWKAKGISFKEKSAWLYFAIALGLVALGIGLAAGFNFDLHGIEPGA